MERVVSEIVSILSRPQYVLHSRTQTYHMGNRWTVQDTSIWIPKETSTYTQGANMIL